MSHNPNNYSHPRESTGTSHPYVPSPSKLAKLETDLRSTLSGLAKTLLNQPDLLSSSSGRSKSANAYEERGGNGERKEGGDLQDVLVEGVKKLGKLVGKWRKWEERARTGKKVSSRSNTDSYDTREQFQERTQSHYHTTEPSVYAENLYGYYSPDNTRDFEHPPRAPSPPESISVYSIPETTRSSRSRSHRDNHNHSDRHTRTFNSAGPYGYTPANFNNNPGYTDQNPLYGQNPDYWSETGTYPPQSNNTTSASYGTKSKLQSLLSMLGGSSSKSGGGKLSLPELINHAIMVVGILEKALLVLYGGNKIGGLSRSKSVNGKGKSGLLTAGNVALAMGLLKKGLEIAGEKSGSAGHGHHRR